jgi:tricorn protease
LRRAWHSSVATSSDTAPNFAIWTPQEGWVVENVGVPPDMEVEMSPAAVIAGHDLQLEKAVELLMADLKKNLPVRAKRPAYPNKVVP